MKRWIVFIFLFIFLFDFIKLQVLLWWFAMTHKYDITKYNCVNYSNDLNHLLEKKGYNSMVVCGVNKNDPEVGHCWVRITVNRFWCNITFNVEPQFGLPVDYSQKYKILNKSYFIPMVRI